MKRKSLIVVVAILLVALFGLVACGGNEPSSSSKPKTSTPASVTPSTNMTAEYASAREKFYNITGLWLPELENVNVLNSTDLPDGSVEFARFDIPSEGGALTSVVSALRSQVGVTPSSSSSSGTVWSYERVVSGTTYLCTLSAVLDNADNPTAVYIDYVADAVSASYMKARTQFKNGTGIQLPLMAGLVVGDHSYDESSKEFTFDIIEGNNMSGDTFTTLKNFFDNLSGWTADPSIEDHAGVYDKYYYFTANDEDMVQLVWQREYNGYGATVAVYVTAFMH